MAFTEFAECHQHRAHELKHMFTFMRDYYYCYYYYYYHYY